MDTKNNFYKLLDIIKSASTREILEAYKNKIIKFNNLSKLSNDQISEIKMLKIALYVLVTQDLRIKYNNFIESENKLSDKKNINEPSAMNQNDETSLDSLFNVDNTWMTSEKKINDNSLKRNKFENNSIGDRIFSMSQFNKRPGYSTDFEIELRKPLQGREDKSTKSISK